MTASAVIGDVVHWRCTECRGYKPATAYREDASRTNGLEPRCFDCLVIAQADELLAALDRGDNPNADGTTWIKAYGARAAMHLALGMRRCRL